MPQRASPSDKRGSECGATIKATADKGKIGGCRNERRRATSEAASAAPQSKLLPTREKLVALGFSKHFVN